VLRQSCHIQNQQLFGDLDGCQADLEVDVFYEFYDEAEELRYERHKEMLLFVAHKDSIKFTFDFFDCIGPLLPLVILVKGSNQVVWEEAKQQAVLTPWMLRWWELVVLQLLLRDVQLLLDLNW